MTPSQPEITLPQLSDYFVVVLCTQVVISIFGVTEKEHCYIKVFKVPSYLEVFAKDLRSTYPGITFLTRYLDIAAFVSIFIFCLLTLEACQKWLRLATDKQMSGIKDTI